MPTLYFITHPDVLIDPAIPVPDWPLSPRGRARMHAIQHQPWLPTIGAIWSSPERKARDGADILSQFTALPPRILPALGENDRSATGYLPKAEFEATADQFFAHPTQSIRGWERATDAQSRIVAATRQVIAASPPEANIALIAHGGVGTLLLCHLLSTPITRTHDQPNNNGGNFFAFDTQTNHLHHPWHPIDS